MVYEATIFMPPLSPTCQGRYDDTKHDLQSWNRTNRSPIALCFEKSGAMDDFTINAECALGWNIAWQKDDWAIGTHRERPDSRQWQCVS
jgi:hypothetical protein